MSGYVSVLFYNSYLFFSFNEATLGVDSGCYDPSSSSLMPPPPNPPSSAPGLPAKTTHISSPKPVRRHISPAKEEQRKSFIKECPPQAFKFYMEQHIEKIWKEYHQRQNRKQAFEQAISQYNNDINGKTKEEFVSTMQKIESNFLRTKRAKLGRNDFQVIKRIGNGAYGVVNLVRKKNDQFINSNGKLDLEKSKNGLYAMKTLRKSLIFNKHQQAHVIAEKDILSEANNDWIVKLHYSFQVIINFENI